jgi:dTDP-4-dehydrorhamnose 3,5-epimerase-like enzyme
MWLNHTYTCYKKKIINTKISGLKILKSKNYYDSRGFFREVFKQRLIKKRIIFGCLSKSKKNVLKKPFVSHPCHGTQCNANAYYSLCCLMG